MSYYYSPIAIQVWCKDYEWKTESYKNGQALAAKHAKKYHHRTEGELVISFGYNQRVKGEDEK